MCELCEAKKNVLTERKSHYTIIDDRKRDSWWKTWNATKHNIAWRQSTLHKHSNMFLTSYYYRESCVNVEQWLAILAMLAVHPELAGVILTHTITQDETIYYKMHSDTILRLNNFYIYFIYLTYIKVIIRSIKRPDQKWGYENVVRLLNLFWWKSLNNNLDFLFLEVIFLLAEGDELFFRLPWLILLVLMIYLLSHGTFKVFLYNFLM